MDGYDASTYGDRFADVYDDWYGDLTDRDACVDLVVSLAGAGGSILELGVGTGRLALPLAARGCAVTGLDASTAMLERLASKPGGERVRAVVGDMASPGAGEPALAGERFDVVLVAYNTFFNLVGPGDQARCLAGVAALLADGGSVVLEAFVPEADRPVDQVVPRSMGADRVVLSVSHSDPGRQEVMGQYVDITEAGIKLRPWHIRWSTPDQIDAMAASAGLALADRWADWRRAPFDADAPTHISRYVAP
jgi:SAM-dependent methyltransferase